MMQDPRFGQGARTLFVFAAAAVLLGCLKLAAAIVVPLLLSLFIAAALKPVIDFGRACGLPNWLAVAFAICVAAGMVLAFSMLVASATGEVREAWPSYGKRLDEQKVQLVLWLQGVGLRDAAVSVSHFDASRAVQALLARSLDDITQAFSTTLLVAFVSIFMLVEVAAIDLKIAHARTTHGQPVLSGPKLPLDLIQRYLLVKTIISAITGLVMGIYCWAFGLSSPVLWGLIQFVLNFIPHIGSVVAAIPAVALALIELGVGPALAIAGGYLAANNLLGNVIEPRIMGRALGLSPVVVLVSVAVWGWLLGPVGALLSVPLTVAVKLYCASTEDLAWVAVLLGPARESKSGTDVGASAAPSAE